jgi:predicted metal-dependent peptidase
MQANATGKLKMLQAHDLYTHRGVRAVQHLVEHAPSTGSLALWVGHHDKPVDAVGPPIATDGNTIFYSQLFESLPLAEQAGLVAHEILHIALRHTQRFASLKNIVGDVDLQLFTICADAIVNSTLGHLNWLKLPAASVYLDRLLADTLSVKQPIEKSLLEWDVERLYRVIDDRAFQPDSSRAGKRGGENGGPGQTEEHRVKNAQQVSSRREDGPKSACARALGANCLADLLLNTDTMGTPEDEAEQTRDWSERIVRGHTSDGAFSMLRTLIADLPRSRTPWELVLRTQLTRSLTHLPAVSWSRPSRSYIANQGRAGPGRRLPWEPGYSGTKPVPRLAIIVDVSGSIDQDLMQRFAREIEAIARRQGSSLVLIAGDDRVRHVERFKPGRSNLSHFEFKGGGGTDFTPLLEAADVHDPDIAVVLSDLDGPIHFRPRWPVIWAVPQSHSAAEPPFGRKLVLS